MMDYSERLLLALEDAKTTRESLARAIGVSAQAIGQVINRGTKALTAENSARAARHLGVDVYWLATGEGQMKPAMSPLAEDAARMIDSITDLQQRKRVHAMLVQMIEFGAPVQRKTDGEP